MPARVALLPAGERPWLAEAIEAGGGEVVDSAAAEGLVWATPGDADGLAAALAAAPSVRWVQLPWAGVEPFAGLLADEAAAGERVWASGKGVYAEPVAEMALALGLAGLRNVAGYARATSWGPPEGTMLHGARVAVLGGGGITEVLLRLLAPFGASVTVVRRRPAPMDGATRVVGADRLTAALTGADLVVLALALTKETVGVIGAEQFELMEPHAWLVNVARGRHVVTDDLVVALRKGDIGGAALDVTDPEPLPADHPLWAFPNCVITPHVGNTPEMAVPLLSARVTENVRRWAAGEPLVGLIDLALGY
ncbi:MAG TPA: D-isomer specific 2-hydroxyacid dehydrogenase family protein [Acidimicrobiales bacterium]